MRQKVNRTTTILLIEDDERDRQMILEALREDYEVEMAVDYVQAKEKINRCSFDVVFLDLMLPERQREKIYEDGQLGLKLLRMVREKEPLMPIVVISGLTTVKTAMEVLEEGIVDFIVKDNLENQLPVIMRRAELIRQGQVERLILHRQSHMREDGHRLVYASPVMQKLVARLESIAKDDISVLLLGETGTGKEVIARELHLRSHRFDGPFVGINCGAIPEGLLESELFGHEKGSFTGAEKRKIGLFELANHGTLFLDEITDTPADLQVKLLRVLQERKFRRVGGEKELPVDVRVISATNKNLEAEIKAERFRKDLLFRIAVVQLVIPPLRARFEDVDVLAGHFIRKYKPGSGLTLSPKLIWLLKSYSWPGNIRELENVIQRVLMVYKGQGAVVYPSDVADCIPASSEKSPSYDEETFDLALVEKQVIEKALNRFGTQWEAAKHLCISECQLRRKIKECGIKYKRVRKAKTDHKREELSGMEKQRRLILEYLESHDEITTRDVIELLGGITKKTAIIRLNELIEAGDIARLARGKYGRN